VIKSWSGIDRGLVIWVRDPLESGQQQEVIPLEDHHGHLWRKSGDLLQRNEPARNDELGPCEAPLFLPVGALPHRAQRVFGQPRGEMKNPENLEKFEQEKLMIFCERI